MEQKTEESEAKRYSQVMSQESKSSKHSSNFLNRLVQPFKLLPIRNKNKKNIEKIENKNITDHQYLHHQTLIPANQMGSLRVPDNVPSPETDCKTLNKAFQGIGTDENGVISVLGHRNASQRKKIKETYQLLYKKSLIDEIFSELSGDFRNAVIMWMTDPAERDAKLANEALKNKKKTIIQLQVIVEIAVAYSPHHLIQVRKAYCSMFNCSLEEDIIAKVPMPLQKILVGLVSSYRYDQEVVDFEVAKSEAAQLNEAIKRKKLDHDGVVWILSTRNIFQLIATFQCYNQNYGKPLDQDIMSCGKGTLELLLKVIVWCIDCPEKHFAEVIKYSIVGLGTDEETLNRAIVCRAEIDLKKAKVEYVKIDKSGMENAVIGDTSGDYKDFLLTLLGATI